MRKAEAYLTAGLSIAAAIILTRSTPQIQSADWTDLLVLSALICASGFLTLADVTAGSLSFVAGGVMAALIVRGPEVAVWAIVLGTLVESLVTSSHIRTLIFNIAQMTVAGWLSGLLFLSLGGRFGEAFNHPLQALVMVGAYMLLNALFFALFLRASGEMSVQGALRVILDRASVRAYVIVSFVGVLVGFAYTRGGSIWALATGAFAYLLSASLRLHFDALREARSQTQQLEAVLNATQGALIMTDRDGNVQVANQQVGTLFGVEPARLIGRPEASIAELAEVRGETDAGREARVITLNRGPCRYVHWYRSKVTSPEGQAHGHIDVFTDVSALKEAERNLVQLHDSMIRALTA